MRRGRTERERERERWMSRAQTLEIKRRIFPWNLNDSWNPDSRKNLISAEIAKHPTHREEYQPASSSQIDQRKTSRVFVESAPNFRRCNTRGNKEEGNLRLLASPRRLRLIISNDKFSLRGRSRVKKKKKKWNCWLAEIHFRDCNQSASSNSSPDNKTWTFSLFLPCLVTSGNEIRDNHRKVFRNIGEQRSRDWNFSSRKRERRDVFVFGSRVPRINARHWQRENHIRAQPSSSSLIDKLIFAREAKRTKRKRGIEHFPPFSFSRQHFRGWTRFTAQIHQFVSYSLAGKKRREICKREIVGGEGSRENEREKLCF